MKKYDKRPGGRGLVVLTACVLAGITPVTALAAKRPNDNLSDVEAPRPDINKDLSPEFAYSQDKWAALRDNVMEYGELADLIHEYNPTVRSNREAYNDMKNKDLNDVYQEAMDAAQDLWDQAGDIDDDFSRAQLNMQGNNLAQSADDLYEDPEMEKIKYDQTEAGLVSQAQQLMITYQQSGYTMENLNRAKDLLNTQYDAAVARQSVGAATAVDVLNAQKSVQDQEAAILSTQKSIDNVHRTLCLMLGWSSDAQPEILPVPEPDLARIDAMNPDADLETAIANNYTIRYNEKKLGNLTSDRLIEVHQGHDPEHEEQCGQRLKGSVQHSPDRQGFPGYGPDAALVRKGGFRHHGGKAGGGIGHQPSVPERGERLCDGKNAVETAKLQLFLAMENYDWIVKGLVSSN